MSPPSVLYVKFRNGRFLAREERSYPEIEGTAKIVFAWLTGNRYRWVVGSNGVWVKGNG